MLPAHTHDYQVDPGSLDKRVDITPEDFVKLTLPIYKAMLSHIPTMESMFSGHVAVSKYAARFKLPKHYTPLSFARLVAMANLRLRLSVKHYGAVLNAVMHSTGLILESNLAQGTVSFGYREEDKRAHNVPIAE